MLIGLGLAALFLVPQAHADEGPNLGQIDRPIHCEGTYSRHLQGVCTNNRDAIYWSFTEDLVKTDLEGRIQKKVPVASHHGDLCFHDGKLFVAVNLGAFNKPAGKADSWIYVYDADTLEELARHQAPEAVHGAGGIAYLNGALFVVGGLPPGTEENYVYEYDASDFSFRKRHVLKTGYTLMGIQTVAFADGHWWFGCYGNPTVVWKADRDFRMVGHWDLNASLGIVGIGKGRLLVATGPSKDKDGCHGVLVPVKPDPKKGFVRIGFE
jgi:hypothetical protein